ncbi:MAG: PAS domain-containing protein [Bacteroidia bacterium]|nr:PAS domain-containing protein [Bacteroidia bacterium]
MNKRLEALSLDGLDSYVQHINKNPDELEELFSLVLIGVTEFFRNFEAFEQLRSILKDILANKAEDGGIRIWSVGCATGEEPYSLAMLICDILPPDSPLNIQIFATDIDDKALAVARKGIYSPQATESIPQDMAQRYFDKVKEGYQIKKNIRQFVLFSRHDVSADPPFVKQNMIICRNLMIYFNNNLQRDTLKTFHYALKEQGVLFLGKSESVSVLPDLFTPLDSKNKIFRRTEGSPMYAMDYGRFRRKQNVQNEEKSEKVLPPGFSLLDNAKESLFNYYEHPFVVVNENHQIQEIKGSLRLYMEMTEGKADVNLIKMVNPELTMELRALLTKLKKTNKPQESKIVRFSLFEQYHFVRIRALPMLFEMHNTRYYMVIFEKIQTDLHYFNFEKDFSLKEIQDLRIQELEQELAASREHIQTFTEELETSNEELQSLNEELQSANEELKSANEELETGNEELQSANEELHTANAELRAVNLELIEKEQQLIEYQKQLQKSERLYQTITANFPNGTVGVIDNHMILEFISGKGLASYSEPDRDRLVGQVSYALNPEESERKKLKMLFEDAFQGHEGEAELFYQGQAVKVFATPLYFAEDGKKVDKVMYLSQDVSDYYYALQQVKESEERFRMLADTAPIMIWMEDKNRRNIYQSKGWWQFTGSTPDDNYGEGWLQFIHPDDRERVNQTFQEAFDKREPFSEEYRLRRADDTYHWILDNGKPRHNEQGDFLGYIGGCIDIHEQKELEKKKDEFMNLASHELKTPLTSAKAYINLATRQLQSGGNAEVVNYLEKANKSVEKLNHLISELLDISRIELGKINPKRNNSILTN